MPQRTALSFSFLMSARPRCLFFGLGEHLRRLSAASPAARNSSSSLLSQAMQPSSTALFLLAKKAAAVAAGHQGENYESPVALRTGALLEGRAFAFTQPNRWRAAAS